MNSIRVITPYAHNGQWVFDDPDKGLVKEPFVAGMDVIIDMKVKDIKNARKGFNVLFSDAPFPGHTIVLTWVEWEYGGNWYEEVTTGLKGWLCPALLKYFAEAPRNIFMQVKEK